MIKRVYYTSLAAVISMATAAQAFGQDAEGGLGDIVVTAERSEKNLQKVSQSVVAISGEELEKRGINSAADLGQFVPGLTVSPGNTPNIFIRGVGTSLASVTGDPGVAVHIDGVFQSRANAVNLGFFDLERVEVLKGPQGTLYGRGSVGGSVNLITAAPKDAFEGFAAAEAGNYGLLRAEGMMNLPLDETSHTAVRIAFLAERRSGYASNGLDDANNKGGRVRLHSEPFERFTIDLSGSAYYGDADGLAFYPAESYPDRGLIADPDNWKTYLNPRGGFNKLTVKEAWATLSYDMDFAILSFQPSVTSIKTYLNNVGLATIGGLPGTTAYTVSDTNANTKMQELRLESPASSPIKWVAGLYHLREINNYLVANGIVGGRMTTDSKSAFGQAIVPFTDSLRAVAGARYTKEKKDQFARTACRPSNPNVICQFNDSWNVMNYRGSLEYDLAERSMLYATYATGFKAGGFFISEAPNSYKPEKVETYELGSKNRFLDNTLQINASLYFSKYRDYQVNVVIPIAFPGATSAGVFNGGDAEIKGAELELIYALTDNDRVEISGNYTDAKFKTITVTGTTAKVGDRLPFTPEYSANLAYTHDFTLPVGKVSFRAETHIEGNSYLSLNHNDITTNDAYTRSNLTLTYEPDDGGYTVMAYVRNLEDVAVRGYISVISGNNAYTLGAPRTYGIRLSKRFY